MLPEGRALPPSRVSPQPSPGPRQTATKFWKLLPTRACISQARVPIPVVFVSSATSRTRVGIHTASVVAQSGLAGRAPTKEG